MSATNQNFHSPSPNLLTYIKTTMTLRFFLIGALVFIFTGLSMAQVRNCATMENLQLLQDQDPKSVFRMEEIERQTKRYLESAERVDGTITIPVVVHIVYRSTAENISDAQIATQIQVLNDDFRLLNSDADGTWPQAADSEIEFCMASVDPNGNATDGITRTQTTVNGHGTNNSVKFDSQGGKDAWPAGDYLNMWVCNIGGGILGYAQFPGGSAATDGVVMDYRYFGTNGTAQSPFDLGRTATHEVGHWLNLRHIWGDGGCGVDDNVADTPLSDAANYGCATNHVSCSTTDMPQNYMDYSDDACMNLFTEGQKTRMRALFDTGGPRASLLNSAACGPPPPPTCTDNIQNGQETGVDCGGPDCAPCPTCDDGVQNGNETGIDCGGPDCAPCPCLANEITLTITFDNYPEETAWLITDAGGATVASGGTYNSEPDGSTLTEQICLPDGCYDFTITDAYGDGICCQYGSGSYTVTDLSDNSVLASGASFGSNETTNICVSSAPPATCDDGVQNGNETGIDCGGPDCAPCASCDDGVQNGSETGIDCGGPDCDPCATCDDGVQNGNETGIDCGGPDCAPCNACGDDNPVSFVLAMDDYPSETSWTLTDQNGVLVDQGGGYKGQPAGYTVMENYCLPDGCYTFTINDLYGDGICCAWGQGGYSFTEDGLPLAAGGEFGATETVQFCVGGVDPNCTDEVINSTNFNNWGVWNDGGTNCRRVAKDEPFAYSTRYCVRINNDAGAASSLISDVLDLSSYNSLNFDFTYITDGMEAGENFQLRVSTDGGNTFTTAHTWVAGTDFNNNIRRFVNVDVPGPFSATTVIRLENFGSDNSDRVYMDDMVFSGCNSTGSIDGSTGDAARAASTESSGAAAETLNFAGSSVKIIPNPANDFINVVYELGIPAPTHVIVSDMNGRRIRSLHREGVEGEQSFRLETSDLERGIYLLSIETNEERIVRKFVIGQ